MEAHEYYKKETGKLYYKEAALELELTDDYINWLERNVVKLFAIPDVSNRALLRVVPVYDGSGTSVTTYKLVDENGNILMMADKATCEWRKEYGY